MPEPGEKRELRSLTALRGLAALAVVGQHFSATAQQDASERIPSLVPHGYIAVDFFFILSGFVMAYVYLDAFRAEGMRAFVPFLGKRVARLLPLNVFVLAAMVVAGGISVAISGRDVVIGFQDPHLVRDFLVNAAMLQGFGLVQILNGPSWSVSTELAAYLAFPALIVVMFRGRGLAVLATLVSVAMLTALASASGNRLDLAYEAPPLSFVHCFTEFAIGMASYRLYQIGAIARLLARDAVTGALVAISLGCMLARYDLVTVATFPLLTIAFAANDGWCARAVQIRPIYGLGVVSYSLYLLHAGFRGPEVALINRLAPVPLAPGPALLFAALGTLSVVPFAWMTYRFVEHPGRSVMRRLFARATTVQTWTMRRAMR